MELQVLHHLEQQVQVILFNATNISLNSLYLLADELPGDNYIYYGLGWCSYKS